jgi:hypothetical protein
MTDLRPCTECRRHVAIAERACPFCNAELAPGSPRDPLFGRLSRAAVFAGAALASTACGGKKAKSDTAPVDQTNQQTTQQADAGVDQPKQAEPDKAPIPMPYGAPPARRRVV